MILPAVVAHANLDQALQWNQLQDRKQTRACTDRVLNQKREASRPGGFRRMFITPKRSRPLPDDVGLVICV